MVSLHRYPLKSVGGEALDAAEVTAPTPARPSASARCWAGGCGCTLAVGDTVTLLD